MKVTLSTSPHIKHSTTLEADFQPRNDLMYSFAPLGLLMLCGAARQNLGFTPSIFDINAKINSNEIQNNAEFYLSAAISICKDKPDVVGFMSECDSYHHVLQICNAIREISPATYIMLGGPHATAVARFTMEGWPCIDAIVLGEGEVSFCELIKAISNHENRVVDGTIMRIDGVITEGRQGTLVESLDDLPFPAYDLYTPQEGEELFLEVGRGCPFQCTFCSTSPFWMRMHRVKSPQRIVDEIRMLKNRFNVKRVHFTHDLFTTNRIWVEDVCNAILDAELSVMWTCSSRVDTVDESLISLMARAGCNAIFFGIESGSEEILDRIKKKISLKKTYEAIELCHRYGISPNAGLIVGFPFETEKTFSDTMEAYLNLMKAGTKPLHIFSYCPFAQSSLYNELSNLEFSGNFLDIPLPESVRKNNELLIRNDRKLFASYYKPAINSIANLGSEILPAIDEFALLVDATRIPSILIAERIGGMKTLFHRWVSFIEERNVSRGKAPFRRFFGAPVDFCEFLKSETESRGFEKYINEMLTVLKTNFEIASGLPDKHPISMATYRSKVLQADLVNVKYQSRITTETVIASARIDHDVLPFLNRVVIGENEVPSKRNVNLVWQRDLTGNVALIEVNAFLYHVISSVAESPMNVEDVIKSWLSSPNALSDDTGANILADLMDAVDKDIVKVKTET